MAGSSLGAGRWLLPILCRRRNDEVDCRSGVRKQT